MYHTEITEITEALLSRMSTVTVSDPAVPRVARLGETRPRTQVTHESCGHLCSWRRLTPDAGLSAGAPLAP